MEGKYVHALPYIHNIYLQYSICFSLALKFQMYFGTITYKLQINFIIASRTILDKVICACSAFILSHIYILYFSHMWHYMHK